MGKIWWNFWGGLFYLPGKHGKFRREFRSEIRSKFRGKIRKLRFKLCDFCRKLRSAEEAVLRNRVFGIASVPRSASSAVGRASQKHFHLLCWHLIRTNAGISETSFLEGGEVFHTDLTTPQVPRPLLLLVLQIADCRLQRFQLAESVRKVFQQFYCQRMFNSDRANLICNSHFQFARVLPSSSGKSKPDFL